jgi:hypothetical protein
LGGAAFGTDDLQPLVGGCSGGGFDNSDSDEHFPEGAYGGGAMQITSRKSINVSGSIRANGDAGNGGGQPVACGYSFFGGGGGGGILLEAPDLTLRAGSTLSATGGDGRGCDPATTTCALPGHGGTGTAAASSGGDVAFTTALGGTAEFFGGSGGGGVGRIRINSSTGSYTADSTAVRNAAITTGMIKTR